MMTEKGQNEGQKINLSCGFDITVHCYVIFRLQLENNKNIILGHF